MTEIDKRSALITFLHQAKRAKWEMLEEYKAKGQLGAQRPDFLWHYLLASFSTWGNSRGYAGLINNPSNYQKVSWSNIENLQDEDLLQVIHETLASAKVSRAKNKAPMLQINARKIKDLGGVEKASDMARSQRGRDAKIAFLRQFKGIGKKYARNIWMDVYDPDFR